MRKNKLQNQQEKLKTINLTSEVEKSLKKLLTHKKKAKNDMYEDDQNQRYQLQHMKLIEQIKQLRSEREEMMRDNHYLSRQILTYKQQITQLSKELRELKKYVVFLEDCNNDLKKQMCYWVKKPKNTNVSTEIQSTHQALSQQIDKLRKINNIRQKQLINLQKTFEVSCHSPNQIDLVKKTKKHSAALNKKQKVCTSCSKDKKKIETKNINKFHSKSFKSQKIKTKLCSCHKSYIETSDFLY